MAVRRVSLNACRYYERRAEKGASAFEQGRGDTPSEAGYRTYSITWVRRPFLFRLLLLLKTPTM